MLKNGQTYVKNLAVFTPQDFQSIFDHFSTLSMKGLIYIHTYIPNPTDDHMFKVSKRNTRTRCEICSKLTI